MITQERLKEKLTYSPDTGDFHWIKSGKKAGTLTLCKYWQIAIDGKTYLAHRLAFLYMTGKFPKEEVDHINMDKIDNRWCNMREATHVENGRNRRITSNNTSGFRGVYFDRGRSPPWRASTSVNGKYKYIGRFKTPELAYMAFTKFAQETYGEFYRA